MSTDRATPKEWVKAYDLADDPETIHLVQKATLETQEFGLSPDVALYGSNEWWQAIDDGRIQKHEISGVISRLYMTGHDDWPQFEIEDRGERSQWTRVGARDLYRVGKQVKIEYVMQRRKKAWSDRSEQREVLRIHIER